ncbi:MAG: Stearoyl-CoA 9-desaturase [Phycisphaerales bacterium]|nr:Stearoyl-CoA 9-desaturase [Phycisphaerales bacterium]MDB5356982.1 Stearoyl-CoA 9-desaturase [Phycisphaerales bacterium]
MPLVRQGIRYRKGLHSLDLLTPAQTWAAVEISPQSGEVSQPHARMPALQRVVMFFSVVGPFVGLLAAIVLLWRRSPAGGGIGWPEVFVMLAMYALAGFGVTIGFHRLLTHRAFETSRAMRWLLAIFGSSAAQGMAIRWCATHRRHHQLSDRNGDPHSPHLHGDGPLALLRGMWHAHVGWCFDADRPALARSVPDLLADRGLLLIDRLYFLWVALGLFLPAIALGLYSRSWGGFVSGLVWGGLVRVFLMQHVTWSINSVCHVWGGRPFNSADHSTNNFPIAILSLGEGWHNNHHAFPTSARHGLRWWQFDATYVVIRMMSRLGLAWNVRQPTASAIDAKLRHAVEAT